MDCNQRYFGQEHFDPGSPGRAFCESLSRLKPGLWGGGFALRDRLPPLPAEHGGVAQVKYNGMFGVALWDEARRGFVVWSHRGRCYYDLADDRRHPVTAWLNERADALRGLVLLGETHVIRHGGDGRAYMTPFNRSMSLIKNPRSGADVARIRFGVFDWRRRDGDGIAEPHDTGAARFRALRRDHDFGPGIDGTEPVHLVQAIDCERPFAAERERLQAFWDEQVGERGFEGLILQTDDGAGHKIKYRDTLDVAVLGFRETGGGVGCQSCGARFDLLPLIQLVRAGRLPRDAWFDAENRQRRRLRRGDPCPLCGAATTAAPRANLGAKIALLRQDGVFVDVADGAQLSAKAPLMWELEPVASADGYLWVRPTHVIEVSYQDLYADRPRPLWSWDGTGYRDAGTTTAVSLRPYGARPRPDKSVNPLDLRLEQLQPLVARLHRIDAVTG